MESDPFYLEIVGASGQSDVGDMAIDDLILEPNTACQDHSHGDTFDCGDENSTQIASDKRCDFIVNCPNGADESHCGQCDFENGKLPVQNTSAN